MIVDPYQKIEYWSFAFIDKNSVKYIWKLKNVVVTSDNCTNRIWTMPIKAEQFTSIPQEPKSLTNTSSRDFRKSERHTRCGQIQLKSFVRIRLLAFHCNERIELYGPNKDPKAVFVARFSRTLSDLVKELNYFHVKSCALD